MLFLFEKNWKNKNLIIKHLDLSCKINIGYPVLYLQKRFIYRKFSVVLSCFITKYAWWNVLWKNRIARHIFPELFFYNVSSITVIVFCLLKDLRRKPFLWLLSYEGTCKHGTIIRTGKNVRKLFYKSLLNSAWLWSRARLTVNKKQRYFLLPDCKLA